MDEHGRYGETLGSGASVLSDLKRSDRVANLAVVLSFALFFFVAAYVAHRCISRSNTVTFLVRPAAKIVFAPIRIIAKIMAFVQRKPVVEPKVRAVNTRGSEADVKAERERHEKIYIQSKRSTLLQRLESRFRKIVRGQTSRRMIMCPTEACNANPSSDSTHESSANTGGSLDSATLFIATRYWALPRLERKMVILLFVRDKEL